MEILMGLLGIIGVCTIVYFIGLLWLFMMDSIHEINRKDIVIVFFNGMFVVIAIGYIYLILRLLYQIGNWIIDLKK